MALDAIQQTALDLDNAIDAELAAKKAAADVEASAATAKAAAVTAIKTVERALALHTAAINAKRTPAPGTTP